MNEVALEYFTKLLAEYKDILGAGQYAAVSEVLRSIENGSSADTLYGYISDDGENSIAHHAENAEDTAVRTFFQALLSVTACLVCAAYRSEGRKYLPEDIESIDEDKLDGFFDFLRGSSPSAEVCFEYFCRNVCV